MALDYSMMRDAVGMDVMNRLSRAQGIGEAAGTLGFLGADAFREHGGLGGLLNMARGRQNPFTQESMADEATIDNIYKTDGDLPESEMYTNEIPQFNLPGYDSSIKPTVAPYSTDLNESEKNQILANKNEAEGGTDILPSWLSWLNPSKEASTEFKPDVGSPYLDYTDNDNQGFSFQNQNNNHLKVYIIQ